MRKLDRIVYAAVMATTVGCAGVSRDCSSCYAGATGADWVIVQTDMDGRPFRCWMLKDVSVSNERESDGIFWESSDGHLVHISNNYNRVQVNHGGFEGALSELGMTQEQCVRLGQTKVEDASR